MSNNKSFDTTAGIDHDGYDDDRLTYWKRSDNNLTHEWTLTNVGDWSSLKTNGTSVSRTHSNAHEINSVGTSNLTHDVKGNLTTNPIRNHNYTWDFDNRMSGADTNGDTTIDINFEYDALGRRVKKGNTVYAYSGQQVIAEYSSGTGPASPTEQYVYASYVDEPILKDGTFKSGTGIVYYSRNQQYSITALTQSSGSVVERYSYSAYGDLTIYNAFETPIANSAYANTFTYTGRRFDFETEIYHFRARMYDAKLGRFVGRDPLGYVDGMSLYRGYFAINGTDSLGLSNNDDVVILKHYTTPKNVIAIHTHGLKPGPDGVIWLSTEGGGASRNATVQFKYMVQVDAKTVPQSVITGAQKKANKMLKGCGLKGAARLAAWARLKGNLIAEWVHSQKGSVFKMPAPNPHKGFHYIFKETGWKAAKPYFLSATGKGSLSPFIKGGAGSILIGTITDKGGEIAADIIDPNNESLDLGIRTTANGVGQATYLRFGLGASGTIGGPVSAAMTCIHNQYLANHGCHPAQIRAKKEFQSLLNGPPNVRGMTIGPAPKIGEIRLLGDGTRVKYRRPLLPWNQPYWTPILPLSENPRVIMGGTKGW